MSTTFDQTFFRRSREWEPGTPIPGVAPNPHVLMFIAPRSTPNYERLEVECTSVIECFEGVHTLLSSNPSYDTCPFRLSIDANLFEALRMATAPVARGPRPFQRSTGQRLRILQISFAPDQLLVHAVDVSRSADFLWPCLLPDPSVTAC